MDFPLILVLLTLVAFVVWAVDMLALAPKRRVVINSLQEKISGWEEEGGDARKRFEAAVQMQAKEPVMVEYARSFLPVLLAVLVLRSFLVEPFQIPSSSMVPTLQIGDFILVNKFTYGIRLPVLRTKVIDLNEPERGDVMVFFPPNDPRYFIKRVIGLPGDHIRYQNKTLYINGEAVEEKLIARLPANNPDYDLREESLDGITHQLRFELHRNGPELGEGITVKPGHYFMMGDNRDNSSDSRVWGQVPEENVVGKAFAVWMHWDSFWSLPSFNTAGIIK